MPKHHLMLVFVAAVLVGSVGGISAQIRGIHFDVTEFIKVLDHSVLICIRTSLPSRTAFIRTE